MHAAGLHRGRHDGEVAVDAQQLVHAQLRADVLRDHVHGHRVVLPPGDHHVLS